MRTLKAGKRRWIGEAASFFAMGLLAVVAPVRAASTADKPPSAPEVPAHPSVPTPPGGQGAPSVPDIPRPPKKVEKLMTGAKTYELKAGEVHKGDLYFMSESVTIAGEQDGDLHVFGREVEVSRGGTVKGDLNAWVQSAALDGTMGDTVRVFCADLKVTGRIEGDLIAVCGQITVEKDAVITGDADLKGAEVDFRGKADGAVTAVGGQVVLSGKVGGDAALKGDVVNVLPGAEVGGDLDYTARDKINLDKDEIVKGEVSYNAGERKARVSTGGFVKWFVFMATGLLASLGTVAIFRRAAPVMAAMVRDDALRSAGIGFITVIVVPVAAALSCILIITIPAVILTLLAWGLLLYFAQVPVALWLGDWALGKIGRPTQSPFMALVAGVPLLYVIFAIPFLGKLALFATLFVGYGAIVICLWTARQARRAGTLPPGSAPMSPSAPVPNAV